MGLISSSRLTEADRAAWARWETYDRVLANDPLLHQAAARARHIIEHFATAGPCYLGVSWGRDSVVTAHLAATSNVRIPLVHVTHNPHLGRVPNPDCATVRDVFLAEYPQVDYHEIPGRLEDIPHLLGVSRYISGVRAAESSARTWAMRRHGDTTATTCRPIGRWSHQQVWAWLAHNDLPVHPAYAMTYGGQLDRNTLRVHSLLGTGADTHGVDHGTRFGRREWEIRYYPGLTVPAAQCVEVS